jgi:hypothetical protein
MQRWSAPGNEAFVLPKKRRAPSLSGEVEEEREEKEDEGEEEEFHHIEEPSAITGAALNTPSEPESLEPSSSLTVAPQIELSPSLAVAAINTLSPPSEPAASDPSFKSPDTANVDPWLEIKSLSCSPSPTLNDAPCPLSTGAEEEEEEEEKEEEQIHHVEEPSAINGALERLVLSPVATPGGGKEGASTLLQSESQLPLPSTSTKMRVFFAREQDRDQGRDLFPATPGHAQTCPTPTPCYASAPGNSRVNMTSPASSSIENVAKEAFRITENPDVFDEVILQRITEVCACFI